jgi:hypothetical protein
MKINKSDILLAWMTLISGLSISAVAVWYSVAGLVSIFAAAAMPIIIMGVVLEVSKLVATVWLKINWKIAPKLIRTYLIVAITILMLITSMGIFGFLSKAHLDQAVPTGDIADKVSFIDEKIKTQKENVDAARKALKQMDESVDQVMARSSDEKGADKAAALRRGQQRERTQLQNDIAKAQKEIAGLNEERAPIAKELRKVEAEVGPIKYIAALLYGDNPDQNLLEAAVRWVIIIIVMVFDPLAVVLLLASQYSFMWFRKAKEEQLEYNVDKAVTTTQYEPDDGPLTDEQVEQIRNLAAAELPTGPVVEKQNLFDEFPFRGKGIPPAMPLNAAYVQPDIDTSDEQDDHEIIANAIEDEAAAMSAWKHDNPNSSLKLQRRLFDKGIITKLPWEDYLKPQADFNDVTENEAAAEALKWAQEQLDERPGDYIPKDDITWMETVDGHQVKKSKDSYQQNAEQGDSTIWQRIQDAKK